jgi:eukaryotic-like serine/threonine-protein kinase
MSDACRHFDALIARRAQLSLDESTALDAHLGGCAACRSLASAVQPVDSLALAATGVTETLPDDAHDGRGDHELGQATTDRYRITGEVGRGGIGRVLRALDQVLDRQVAVKELFSASEGTRKRFVREALITARLQHPSIVPVYDAGHLGDRSPFYAMKLVAGRPLDKAIAEATTLAQRLALLPSVLAVADAMAYAHDERIVHRDLKPANVLVGKYGETIVIDWGLAKDLAVDDTDALDAGPYRAAGLDHTVAGAVLGTPAYMAPEQAAGEPVAERADVYALGAILYHVVSGTIPHEGTTLEDMVSRVIRGEVRSLIERVPDVPRDLAAIVTKAMALDPAARYANAQGLADDLRRFLNGQLVASHVYGTRELVRRWVKRHRAAVTVAVASLAVVGVIGVVSITRIMRASRAADEAAATATQTLADMMAEQGRQELVAGHPGRAAVYLSHAYRASGEPSVALRTELAIAMRGLEAERMSLAVGGFVSHAVFSPDGTRIVTGGGRTAKIWDAGTGKLVTTLQGGSHEAMAVSADAERVVTAGVDRFARLWDARTGTLVAKLGQA